MIRWNTYCTALAGALVAAASVSCSDGQEPATTASESAALPGECGYTVTAGDDSHVITPLEGSESVVSFYSYDAPQQLSANTGYELSDVSTVFVYKDTTSDTYSLVLINDEPNDGTGGTMHLSVGGVPLGSTITVRDDLAGDSVSDPGSLHWNWISCCTDGMALTFPGGDFCVELEVLSSTGLDGWSVMDGDESRTTYEFETLTICANTCNQPPVAVCADATVDADAACQGQATVDGGSYDPDGDVFDCVQDPEGPFDLGETSVTLTCTDEFGAISSCEASVTVIDTTPPEVVTGELGSFWPPNHDLYEVSLDACVLSAVDNCDGDLTGSAAITQVSSDEVEDGQADGQTCDDLSLVDAQTVSLRAERSGSGNGRVYQVGFGVSDAAGNTTGGSCSVGVPHDDGEAAVDDGCQYCVGEGCGDCDGASPACE